MISDFFFACPRCGCRDCVATRKRKTLCEKCGVDFERMGRAVRVGNTVRPAYAWFDQIAKAAVPLPTPCEEVPLEPGEQALAVSEAGTLRQANRARPFKGFLNHRARVEELQTAGTARVVFTDRRFVLVQGKAFRWWPLEEVRCVTTDAREFVVKVRNEGVFHIEFPHQSPLWWELVSREILRRYWALRDREVIEYQPFLRFRDQEKLVKVTEPLVPPDTLGLKHPRDHWWREVTYWAVRAVARAVFELFFELTLEGREHLPKRGPYILIANHEGYLDSFFILAALPVKLGFLAKNTEFDSAFHRWAMRVFRSVPVHRHRPDPVAVANTLRLLRRGAPVAIFPEGERTWDGRLLPPKRTTVKLLMRAGVPVVPCRVIGSYDVLPRWDTRMQKHDVTVRLGPPFRFDESVASVEEAIEEIQARLEALGPGKSAGSPSR